MANCIFAYLDLSATGGLGPFPAGYLLDPPLKVDHPAFQVDVAVQESQHFAGAETGIQHEDVGSCRGILPDPHEMEECLARIRVKLWEKLPSYQEETASLSTWLTAVCRNAAYDRLRQLQRQAQHTAPLTDRTPDPSPAPEEALLRQERLERLKKALNTLRDSDRRLFYRKYYYLQSTAQIAAELGLSQRAVEGRLYRIRTRLGIFRISSPSTPSATIPPGTMPPD